MGSASRPDLTVHLPGGFHLAVDAKVPLSAMLRAQDITGQDAAARRARAELMSEHAKAMRAHINELAKRDYPAQFPDHPSSPSCSYPPNHYFLRHLPRTQLY